jgi:hypothetical protein
VQLSILAGAAEAAQRADPGEPENFSLVEEPGLGRRYST